MRVPRYSEYKSAGISWIDEIPIHWRTCPLFAVAKERLEPNEGMREDNLLSLSYGRIVRKDIDSNDGLLPESFETYQIVWPGDIVLRLTDLQNDKRSLRSAWVCERGIITSAYLALCPTRIGSRYLSYLLRAYDLSKVFYSMGGGLRQSMKFSDLRRLPTILPSDDEQRAIGDFLDRETTKIDTLIAEQERLIALLAEKRQATILHVVRRGFDATVTTKDSGLSWIGEVPSHWRICSVGYLCSIATGATPEREEPRYWNGSIPWLKTGEINWAPVAAAEEFITTAALEETSVKVAMPGALLMAMYGQGATRGRVALLQIEAAFNQACAALSFDSRMSPEYARYFFMAAYDYVRDVGNETSQMNLSAGLISKMKVTVPPLTEQLAIVKLLDRESSKLEKLIAKAEGAVTLLKERRSALIAAAVTGQIDVRSHAPALSPEIAEAAAA